MSKISPLEELKSKVELLEDDIAEIQEGAINGTESESSLHLESESEPESGTAHESEQPKG